MKHFLPVGPMETWPLVASLYYRQEAFDRIKLRQTYPGTPHQDTRSIFLRGPITTFPGPGGGETGWRQVTDPSFWFQDVPQKDYPLLEEWPEAAETLDKITMAMRGAILGKVMIIELKPGGALAWHTDEGAYAEAHARYHLPLVTNPGALMYAGVEQAHLPVGMLTQFDNRVLHSAVNLGAEPRIHLVVDVRR